MQATTRESTGDTSRWLKGLLGNEKRWVRLSIAAGIFAGLMLVLQAHLLARAVNETLFQGAQLSELKGLLVMLLLALLFRGASGVLREWSGQRASVGVRSRLRAELLARLAQLGPAYSKSQRSGELSSLLMEQVEALDGFIARYLPQMALAGIIPLVILAFVLPINWAAVLIFLATAPLIPLFMAMVGTRAAEANRRNFRALAQLSGYFLDVVQGLGTLKLFSRSQEQQQIIADNADEFRIRTMQVLRLAFLSSAVLEFFASISIAILAVYLGFSFLGLLDFGSWGGEITLYHALFLLILAPEFYLPLRELGTHYHSKQEAIAAAERIIDLLDEQEYLESGGQQVLPESQPDLKLHQISFSYPEQPQPVLHNFCLQVAPGECVALVGPSGAGKSTVLNLLAGFDCPQQGEIRISTIPLAQLSRSVWMEKVAFVSQHTTLFPGSIRDNLLMANPQATDDQIRAACDQAAASEFIDCLAEGLDTRVGEAGANFSGGQIQRLSLARAFLKNAPVLLLDEPTASLDLASEELVLQALARLCRGRTTLLLTHRPATMRLADRLCVLQQGECVEADAALRKQLQEMVS
ncbi:thiol reductant ABC exporter subunit CydD [Nitrincola iocasae]|uniref:Thiol reductant ABC exporter subunit CydD n=1 Tax=Nitrincola iocasae TaxID=2614693 RepID=A0A5J6LEB4_9GAMM|nr:thiol reductant ABC exporter subunit CydD [Nitrincola iocasae]QEW06773.1 thiol reductant ABC exporter subunit CydD [Nitrincola iocasae]